MYAFGYWGAIMGVCFVGVGGGQNVVVAEPAFAEGVSLAYGKPPDSEISGIAASVTSPGVYWVHGDSDGVRVHAIDSSLQRLGTYEFGGAEDSENYEDIAIGPGPLEGVSYIYFGDIGDNGFNRWNIKIYRMPEPVVYTWQASAPVSKSYSDDVWEYVGIWYPGIPFMNETDAEGLMVDPRNGDVYICSKESDPGQCRVFRVPASEFVDGATVNVSVVATKGNMYKATAACIQPQGNELIIRGYDWAYLFRIGPGQSIQDALNTSRIAVPLRSEPQGEAIGYEKNGGGYLTISEGNPVNLWYFARSSNDGPTPEVSLIPPESPWRYLDNGSDQGTAWRSPGFDDTGWSSGPAQFGYGDGDEQTVVSYGGNPSNKHITTYFRSTFCLDTSMPFETLHLRVVYEGGIAVYLNGTQVLRKSLAGDASSSDPATGTRGISKYSWYTVAVDHALLIDGENTVAVEVHLANANQQDMSFDLQLEGTRQVSPQIYPVNVVTASEPPGLITPAVVMDDGASDIETGGARSFWVLSSATDGNLPYAAFETATNLYNLGATGGPVCHCPDYANGGDSGCWPRVTVTNAHLYKGNAAWPAANHFDWYTVYYPTAPVTITATYKARDIPVTYGDNISGPAIIHHEVTGHSIVVVPTMLPGHTLMGVLATNGITVDLGDGTWRLSKVTDFAGTTVTALFEAEGQPEGMIEGMPSEGSPEEGEGGIEGQFEGVIEEEGEGILEGEGDSEGALFEGTLEEGQSEGTIEGAEEGGIEGQAEGQDEGQREGDREGPVEEGEEGWAEGTYEGQKEGEEEGMTEEGSEEGTMEGEGVKEGIEEGEGSLEGQVEGMTEGSIEGEGEGREDQWQTADQDHNNQISLSELLRLIQFFNSDGFHCQAGTEDGYAPGQASDKGLQPLVLRQITKMDCFPHSSDYAPQDWLINLSELLRLIQFFNSGGYHYCPEDNTEDGFCPGVGAD